MQPGTVTPPQAPTSTASSKPSSWCRPVTCSADLGRRDACTTTGKAVSAERPRSASDALPLNFDPRRPLLRRLVLADCPASGSRLPGMPGFRRPAKRGRYPPARWLGDPIAPAIHRASWPEPGDIPADEKLGMMTAQEASVDAAQDYWDSLWPEARRAWAAQPRRHPRTVWRAFLGHTELETNPGPASVSADHSREIPQTLAC
jgi:hypothetical protein